MKALLILLGNIAIWWIVAWLTWYLGKKKLLAEEFYIAYCVSVIIACGAIVLASAITILHIYVN